MNLLEQNIMIGDQRLAYVQDGPRDRTVLFIHGNSSCKAAFVHQIEAIRAAGYGVLAMDLPGHGNSADAMAPETDYTLPAYAALIQSLCRRLDVSRPIVCGWSLGGHIAIQMLGDQAECAGLTICGTPPIGLDPMDAGHAFLPSAFSTVTGDATPTDEALAGYIAAVYGTLTPVPDVLETAGRRTDGLSRAHMVAHWQTGQGIHDQRAIIEQLQAPLLIIHGREDAFVSADYFDTLKLLGSPTLEMIDAVGHAPFLEAPEVFNGLLLNMCRACFDA